MKCYTCGGTCEVHNGTIGLHNKIIGSYNIYDATYYKCGSCGKISYPKGTVIKIESVENETKNKLISLLPISEFILAAEAAELLGISKQAFSKNRRIKNGFIFSVSLGGKRLFNKKSILLFKESGDGRFKLSCQQPEKTVRYIPTVYMVPADTQYKQTISDIPEHSFWQKELKVNHPIYLNC